MELANLQICDKRLTYVKVIFAVTFYSIVQSFDYQSDGVNTSAYCKQERRK